MRPEPTARILPHLEEAWKMASAAGRLEAVETAALGLRATLEDTGAVLAARTFDIASFPYPTQFAFAGACAVPVPYVWMKNRAVFLEYRDLAGEKRRLLVNPTRPEGSKKAPYFKSLLDPVPVFAQGAFEKALSDRAAPLPEQLKAAGIDPASIDFITFDHLHVQEVGPLLGPSGSFPNARLLATETELGIAGHPHPLQRWWYVDGALEGTREDDFLPFDRDILLGEGVALIRTPGHTEGNHTIVFTLPDGLVTISENGVGAECYRPHASHIPGLARHAQKTGETVILNANTLERTLDQYTSMRLEAILADAQPFPRHFSSSELVTHLLAPGIKPTFAWQKFEYGQI